MSVARYYNIQCDGCYSITPGGIDDIRDIPTSARRAAKQYGWKRLNGLDLCPACHADRVADHTERTVE